jgi:hypothetical protein
VDHFNTIIVIFLLLAGPCAVVYSLVSIVRTRDFLLRSTEVDGEVIRLERSRTGGQTSTVVYAPVFSFTAADGRAYTVTSKVSSSAPGFSVGDSVRVRYDPANPEGARIHTFFQTWGAALISGAVGAGFVAFGCKLLWFLN